MTQTPFEDTESLRVGTIEFVSPSEIKVLLNTDTPDSVALNTTTPRAFPKVNSYLIVPNEQGFLVGQVEWLTIEHSDYPKIKGLQDFGLVDLPYPLRKLKLNPLGTLKKVVDSNSEVDYKFERGADTFPSVGEGVLIPTDAQLNSIIESSDNPVQIGNSPLAGNAKVKINPDKIFGRHLAVLGNTGSGKSCSVAGLIRWSLEQASKENAHPNARFIILDPNGEYKKAFKGENDNDPISKFTKVFKLQPSQDENKLRAPSWLWNAQEWSSFTNASEGAQRPILQQALRLRRNSQAAFDSRDQEIEDLTTFLQGCYNRLNREKKDNSPFELPNQGAYWRFIELLRTTQDSLRYINDNSQTSFSSEIDPIFNLLDDVINKKVFNDKGYNKPLDYEDVEKLLETVEDSIDQLGGDLEDTVPLNEDTPIPFSSSDLINDINFLARNSGNPQWFEFLIARIRTLLNDERMSSITEMEEDERLGDWLDGYVGNHTEDSNKIAIIDLSLIPSDIVNIVTASIARIIFEGLQRYRDLHDKGKVLPTCLVMEEAHTFVNRYSNQDGNNTGTVCCQVFERIAREGRKFGLGLVLSSQRPSELSPTVLSQCNTFLLHRISNDKDQELVQRFVPDNLKGLLRELPSLPSQNAILMGWATEIPVMVRMNALPEKHQPQSEDPDFWNVWTRKSERTVDWERIAADWQRREYQESSEDEANNDDNNKIDESDERNDNGQTGDEGNKE